MTCLPSPSQGEAEPGGSGAHMHRSRGWVGTVKGDYLVCLLDGSRGVQPWDCALWPWEHLHPRDKGPHILGVCPVLSFLLLCWSGAEHVRDHTAAAAGCDSGPAPAQARPALQLPHTCASLRPKQWRLRAWLWWPQASGAARGRGGL